MKHLLLIIFLLLSTAADAKRIYLTLNGGLSAHNANNQTGHLGFDLSAGTALSYKYLLVQAGVDVSSVSGGFRYYEPRSPSGNIVRYKLSAAGKVRLDDESYLYGGPVIGYQRFSPSPLKPSATFSKGLQMGLNARVSKGLLVNLGISSLWDSNHKSAEYAFKNHIHLFAGLWIKLAKW